MYLDVFIGAVDVPGFSWGESPADNDYSAVVPRFISHAIPDSYEAFFELKDRINKGQYTSKAIDWGTWLHESAKLKSLSSCRACMVRTSWKRTASTPTLQG